MPEDPRQRRAHPISRPDLAFQLITDITRQASDTAREAKRDPPKPHPRRRVFLMVLLLVLAGLTAWNAERARSVPQVFSPAQEDASLRLRMFLAVQTIEAYHSAKGAFPPTLAAVDIQEPGWTYILRDSSYTLSDSVGALHLTYRHGEQVAGLVRGLNLPQPRTTR